MRMAGLAPEHALSRGVSQAEPVPKFILGRAKLIAQNTGNLVEMRPNFVTAFMLLRDMDRGATTENGFTDQNIISTMQGTDEDKKKDLLFPNSFKNAPPDQKYEKFKERFNDEIKVAIYHKRMEEFLPHYIDISVVKHLKATFLLSKDTKGVEAVRAALELARDEISKTNFKDYTGNSSRGDAIIVLGFMYGKNDFATGLNMRTEQQKKTKVLRGLMMQIIPHDQAGRLQRSPHLQTLSNPNRSRFGSAGGGRRRTKKRKTKKRKSKKRKSKRRKSTKKRKNNIR
jgi:hypothetical protein